ncbi:MAG: hypothetical protein IKF46_04705 [Erysipelotrichaceae bacterium]|nr:hypothetical protein [Erysipelotrichaceae bacterium]
MEEKRFCIFCGSPLSDSDKCCPVCRKEIPIKENLFKEYLYRNTKESLKGKVDDTLFNIVKNWILSHLYGLVVSIVLIGLAGINLVSPQLPSYITKMNSSSHPAEVSSAQTEQTEEEGSHSGDASAVDEAVHRYTDSVFYFTVTDNGRKDVQISKYKDGPPPPPEAYYIPKAYDNYPVSSYYFVDTSYHHIETFGAGRMQMNEPTTEIGKMLKADGFPTAELEVTNRYKDESGEDAPVVRTDRFLFVLVKMDGEWYIAETKLIEQEG